MVAVESRLLDVHEHSRDSAGMTYVYPVVSRRAGGVSLGINLNPNNACNWHCVYCQVPDLRRGGPPPIDLDRLRQELSALLDDIEHGDFLARRVPEDARRLVDLAFSGNGEPTSAAEFPDAVDVAAKLLADRGLLGRLPLRLITNGSLVERKTVREGVKRLAAAGGEVWFKLDAGRSVDMARINATRTDPERHLARLLVCADLAPTWVQSCFFAWDGAAPDEPQVEAYLALLSRAAGRIRGVHLYGVARPSLQPGAGRISPLPVEWFEALACRLRLLETGKEKGLTVTVSP